jgi:GST-like protein
MTPIELHTYQTPNGHKASIMLEEVGLPYVARLVDITRGDQTSPGFLALNPNNKIPVIVDPDAGRTVFESGAILHYLAERSGRLLPSGERARTDVLAWTFFQAAHVGPTLGQLWNFKVFATEKLPSVIARFERETARILRVLDGQLERHAHVAGAEYGIADIMTWPWIHAAVTKLGVSLEAAPRVESWYHAVAARPAVGRGLAVPAVPDGED